MTEGEGGRSVITFVSIWRHRISPWDLFSFCPSNKTPFHSSSYTYALAGVLDHVVDRLLGTPCPLWLLCAGFVGATQASKDPPGDEKLGLDALGGRVSAQLIRKLLREHLDDSLGRVVGRPRHGRRRDPLLAAGVDDERRLVVRLDARQESLDGVDDTIHVGAQHRLPTIPFGRLRRRLADAGIGHEDRQGCAGKRVPDARCKCLDTAPVADVHLASPHLCAVLGDALHLLHSRGQAPFSRKVANGNRHAVLRGKGPSCR